MKQGAKQKITAEELYQKAIRLITVDFWRKLMAVFLATLLYIYVIDRNDQPDITEIVSGVPVEVTLPPNSVNTGGVSPVNLKISGRPDDVKNLTASSLRGKIQIESFASGETYTRMLSPADFTAPDGITILGVEPKELRLNIDQVITRSIAVEAKFDSEKRLPADYYIPNHPCTPNEVQVTGPASLVREMRMITTMPIPLDDTVTDSFDYNAQIKCPDGVSVAPRRITVHVDIARKYGTRTFKGVPLLELLASGQRTSMSAELLNIPHVEVDVSGPQSKLQELDSKNLRPFLDISGIHASGTFSLTPGCIITGIDASELKIKQIRPDRISIKSRFQK